MRRKQPLFAASSEYGSLDKGGALPGLDHLILCREVEPELESPEVSLCDLGHLAVDDAPASCHPLHAPILYHPLLHHNTYPQQTHHP